MSDSISIAKALHTFFSTLPKPVPNRSFTTLSAISEKYGVGSSSVELFELVHVQRGNLLAIIQRLDATGWPDATKKASRKHLTDLLQAIDHHGLLRDWKDTKAKFVDPNLSTLLLLEQSLHLQSDLTEEQQHQIQDLVETLESASGEAASSDLPVDLRGKIVASLSVLVLLLKNYKVVGVARAWEVASSTLLALTLETQSKPEKDSGTMKRVLKVLASSVVVLGLANGLLTGSGDLISNAAGAMRAIGALFRDDQKLLEHMPLDADAQEANSNSEPEQGGARDPTETRSE